MVTGRVPREVTAGQLVASKYRIERVIASGGQGTVVEATHLRLNQSVAIKFPHVDGAEGEQGAFERMFREARASFRLGGAHVARTIDVDVVDGAPFIVMEYLRGVDLKAYVAERGALPVADAVGLLLQTCEAVAEAHDLGIIHRDLKPSNLFLVDQPDGALMLKVLDFGLSKSPELDPKADISDLTEPQRMLGSPRYMSPEQVSDPHHVDARSDIWSLGVILQELLTGAPMFRARTHVQALAMVLTRSPAPVSVLRPDVPPEIERVVLRCLQKMPEHRFATARELAQALAPYAPPWALADVERMLPRTVVRGARAARGRSEAAPDGPGGRRRRFGTVLKATVLGGVVVGAIALGVVGRDGIVGLVTKGVVIYPVAGARAEQDVARSPMVVEPIAAAPAPEPAPPSAPVVAEPSLDEQASGPSNRGVEAKPGALQSIPRTRGAAPVASTKRLRERRRAAEGVAQHKPRAPSSKLVARSTATASSGLEPPAVGASSVGDEPGPLEGRK